MKSFMLGVMLVVITSLALAGNTLDITEPLQRIAFGSCAMQFKPQPIWDTISEQKPDLFLFLGDNIYGDFDGEKSFTPTRETLTRDWKLLANQPGFKRFRQQVPIMATWDNHDYGKHNGGAEFEFKELTKTAFLDFFGEAEHSERRSTPGIYDARIVGPAGKRVQIIMLDTRYFKGPFIKDTRSKQEKIAAGNIGSMGNYLPNEDPEVTLLGEQQWAWLEEQLKQPAEIRLLVSSTQVIADQKAMDEWGNYPLERKRLLDLLGRSTTGKTIILSGNVHFTEISTTRVGDRKLIDFSSSGLTHSNPGYAAADNPYRVAGPYDDLNFGLLEIDWESGPAPVVLLKAMDKQGVPVFQYRL